MTVASLIVDVGANVANLTKGTDQVLGQLDRIENASRQADAGIGSLSKTVGGLADVTTMTDAELTAMAGGLDTVAVASQGASLATAMLAKSMALIDAAIPILGAFTAAYMIVEPIAEKFFQAQDDAALKAQTLAAQQDKVNQAIAMGASPMIKYAEAIDFVNAAFARREAQDPVKAAQAYLDKLSENERKAIDVAAAEAAREEGLARLGIVEGQTIDVERLMTRALNDQRQAHEKATREAEKATREAERFQQQLDRSTASAHKVEAGFFGLRAELGKVDTTDRDLAASTAKLTEKINSLERSAYVAQFGFKGMADELTHVGTKSTELEQLEKHLKAVEDAERAARREMQQLANALYDLSGAFGGAFGGVVNDIANIVDSLNQATKAADDYANATTAAGKAAAVLQGIAAVGQATSQGSTGMRIAGGAMAGAQAGSMFGPIGMGVGAGLGALVGWYRGAHQEMQINPLRERFVQDAGGLAILNEHAHEVGMTLDHLLDARNPQQYKAAIDELNGAFERQKAAVAALPGYLSNISDGMNEIAAGTIGRFDDVRNTLVDTGDAMVLLREKASKLAAQIYDMEHKDHALSQTQIAQLEIWKRQLADVQTKITALDGVLGDAATTFETIGRTGQEQFDRIGRLASLAFNSAIAGGKSFLQAITDIGPTLDILTRAQDSWGFAASDTLKTLLRFREFAEENKALVASVDGVNQMMKGLQATGLLTQAGFDDLNGVATHTYDEMIAKGLDADSAVRLMQPTLQTIWELHTKNGLAVDDATQALLDQASAAGIVGPQMESMNQQLLDVLTSIRDVLAEATGNANGLGAAMRNIPRPPPPFSGDSSPLNPEGMASGGFGHATGPRLFYTAGNEDYAFSGEGKRFGSGGDRQLADHVKANTRELQGLRRDMVNLIPLHVKAAIAQVA